MILVRIVGRDFVAGALIEGEKIVRIAPLLAAMMRRRGLRGRAGLRALVRDLKLAAEVAGADSD